MEKFKAFRVHTIDGKPQCRFEELTVEGARAAGALCARAQTADLIDASVVIGALLRNDLVLTSDAGDLERLAAASGRRLQVHCV